MQQDSRLQEASRRWALVTGASAGIGAEFCRQLAARGYNLVMVARRQEKMADLADELQQQFGTRSRVYPSDLAVPGASAGLASWLLEQNIDVEFLVNNAGYGLPGHFTDVPWKSHADFIQLMLTAICELSWQLLPAMQARKRGYVINVASLAGLVPGSAGHTLYGASKAFLVRFSQSLALENEANGVHVSALCPGFTYSEFHDVTGTRGLVNKLPGWMWMTAEDVVSYGIASVVGKRPLMVAIPGRVNRLIEWLLRCLPSAAGYWVTRRMSGRIRAQKTA